MRTTPSASGSWESMSATSATSSRKAARSASGLSLVKFWARSKKLWTLSRRSVRLSLPCWSSRLFEKLVILSISCTATATGRAGASRISLSQRESFLSRSFFLVRAFSEFRNSSPAAYWMRGIWAFAAPAWSSASAFPPSPSQTGKFSKIRSKATASLGLTLMRSRARKSLISLRS